MPGIRWDIGGIRSVTAGQLSRILRSFRNSRVPLKDYNRLGTLRHNGQANEATSPLAGVGWRALIKRFNVDDELPLEEWIAIVDSCIKLGWEVPSSLALSDTHPPPHPPSFAAFVTRRSLPL